MEDGLLLTGTKPFRGAGPVRIDGGTVASVVSQTVVCVAGTLCSTACTVVTVFPTSALFLLPVIVCRDSDVISQPGDKGHYACLLLPHEGTVVGDFFVVLLYPLLILVHYLKTSLSGAPRTM
jgi:hypothetical protein